MIIDFNNRHGGQGGGVTTGQVQTMINNNNSAYTRTDGFATINNSAVTAGGNIEIKGGATKFPITFSKNVVSGEWEIDKTIEQITAAKEKDEELVALVIPESLSLQYECPLISYYNNYGVLEIKFEKAGAAVVGSAVKTVNIFCKIEGEDDVYTYDCKSSIGGGQSGEQVIELTQAQYNALTGYAQNTTYVITDAAAVDMDDYATTDDLDEFSAATIAGLATKANKQVIASPFTGASYYSSTQRFPVWNVDGVITGSEGNNWGAGFSYINGQSKNIMSRDASTFTIYAPTVGGTLGQVLKSSGNAAPTWVDLSTMTGGVKFWKGTEEEYEAIATKDSSTLYIIVEE